MKNLKELKDRKIDLLTKISEAGEKDKPDLSLIKELQAEVDLITTRIPVYKELEQATADRIAAEKKISDVANVGAGTTQVKKEVIEEKSLYEKYSLISALGQIANKEGLSGAEAEVFQEATLEAKSAGVQLIGNIAIPQKMIHFPGIKQKAPVSMAVEAANIMQTDVSSKIPLLEIDPAVIRAGARVFTGLNGDIQFPRNLTGAVLAWEGEEDQNAESTPTYEQIKMTPHRLSAYIDYTIQAGIQSSFDLESDLRERLSRAYSIEWDRVALLGSGMAAEPLGIANYTGVGVVAPATGSITWPVALNFPKALNQANVPMDGRQAYIGPATAMADLMAEAKDAGSGLFVMNDSKEIAGYPFHMDNNLPIDGGTAMDEYTIIFGRWNSMYMGQWAGFSVLFDPYTQAGLGTNRLQLNAYLDVQLEHPEAFAMAEDVIP